MSKPAERPERELRRELGSFQQGMIAIGGIVGVGLFLGSGATIGLAGPAVIVAYGLGAIVAVALGFVLAEMAVVHPVTGGFGAYADDYIGPFAGFATRLSYWFAETFAIGAMVTAVGVYPTYWFPDTPAWVFTVSAATVALALNALGVRHFGAAESLFSMVKLAAIASFVALGAALVLGRGESHLLAHGGFAPQGVTGVALSLTLVVASFLGIEAVSVTAAEARHPETTVPRALFGVVGTLVVLYTASMLVMVTILPWTEVAETGGTLTRSPFVTVFQESGIPFSAGLMNAVVISAALTGAIGHLYLATRMLHSLAREGYAPQSLARLDGRGVPFRALLASTAGLLLAVAMSVFSTRAFLPLYGTAVVALLTIWLVIFGCHARFRRQRSKARGEATAFRAPFHPLLSFLASAIIIASLAVTPWVAGLEWTVPMFAAWLSMLAAAYRIRAMRATRGGT